jgi:hypothetical protein
MGFAPPPHDGFALLASAHTRMRLSAGIFPMLAMIASYTEPRATQYLSEKAVHTEVVLRVDVPHMWFRTEVYA